MAIYIGNHNLRFTVDVTEETEKDFWEKKQKMRGQKTTTKRKNKKREKYTYSIPPLCFLFFSSFSFSSLIKMHKYFFQ